MVKRQIAVFENLIHQRETETRPVASRSNASAANLRNTKPAPRLVTCALYSAAIFHPMQTEPPFNERGVTLSRAGLSAAGQMFPLRDLRSARVVRISRKKPLPITMGVIGLVALVVGAIIGSGPALVLGLMIAVVGYLSWITQDVIYQLLVTTPDGEREVLITKDQEFADRVAVLVHEAIAKHARNTAPSAN